MPLGDHAGCVPPCTVRSRSLRCPVPSSRISQMLQAVGPPRDPRAVRREVEGAVVDGRGWRACGDPCRRPSRSRSRPRRRPPRHSRSCRWTTSRRRSRSPRCRRSCAGWSRPRSSPTGRRRDTNAIRPPSGDQLGCRAPPSGRQPVEVGPVVIHRRDVALERRRRAGPRSPATPGRARRASRRARLPAVRPSPASYRVDRARLHRSARPYLIPVHPWGCSISAGRYRCSCLLWVKVIAAGQCRRRGGETRTRTGDTTIFSRVLYQLSYLATRAGRLALRLNPSRYLTKVR